MYIRRSDQYREMQPTREMQAVLVRGRAVLLVRGIAVCISSCVAGWGVVSTRGARRWVRPARLARPDRRHHKKALLSPRQTFRQISMDPVPLSRDGAALPSSTPTGIIDLTLSLSLSLSLSLHHPRSILDHSCPIRTHFRPTRPAMTNSVSPPRKSSCRVGIAQSM